MNETRERLWPRKPEEGEAERREREERERGERRRKAKERQQKLMEEFASKQKQFMEKAMETGEPVSAVCLVLIKNVRIKKVDTLSY